MNLKEHIKMLISDKVYLRYLYKKHMGKRLNLSNPQTFNEKLQWLKLYNRKPEYTQMVDKYEVKKYVAEKIGEEYIIPTLGVWDKFEDINFDKLPNQFVLKCTHDSGGLIICKDKSIFDFEQAKKKIEKSLERNYFYVGREWPYKNVKPRILGEKYMEDTETRELRDYKFFCFDGYVDNVMIVTNRFKSGVEYYHFDKEWRLRKQYNRNCRTLPADFNIPKPLEMDYMFKLASKLSRGFPHIRIDFYLVNNKIYFGEFTFFNQSGFDTDLELEADLHMGALIKLPNKNII